MADLGFCLFICCSVCVAGPFGGRPRPRPRGSQMGINSDRSDFNAERGRCCVDHGRLTDSVEAIQRKVRKK